MPKALAKGIPTGVPVRPFCSSADEPAQLGEALDVMLGIGAHRPGGIQQGGRAVGSMGGVDVDLTVPDAQHLIRTQSVPTQ